MFSLNTTYKSTLCKTKTKPVCDDNLLWVAYDTFLVDLSPLKREDFLVVHDDGFDDLVDVSLVRDLVAVRWNRQKRWSKTDGEVVWVHHVFVRVLGQTVTKMAGGQ